MLQKINKCNAITLFILENCFRSLDNIQKNLAINPQIEKGKNHSLYDPIHMISVSSFSENTICKKGRPFGRFQ